MKLYPAIDLHHGHCVRLYKGDYEQQTDYSADPVTMAQTFQAEGASDLHIVDLMAAKNPETSQLSIINDITQSVSLTIQTGGGVRTEHDLAQRLEQGVQRVVIGSHAVKAMAEVKAWFKTFGPDQLVLALDVKQEADEWHVAIHGWQQTSELTLDEVLAEYLPLGVKHVLCTDINSDGTLQGPNFQLYKDLVARYPGIEWQASGGVSSLDDLRALKETGVAGVIIGRALYEKQFTLTEALNAVKETENVG